MIRRLAALCPDWLSVFLWKNFIPDFMKKFILRRANARFNAGIIGLITNGEGKLLLVKHTYKTPAWGLPGGNMGLEQPLDGLRREIREETGFVLGTAHVVDTIFDRSMNQILIIAEAKIIAGEFKPCAEVSDYAFVSVNSKKWLNVLPKFQKTIIIKHISEGGFIK